MPVPLLELERISLGYPAAEGIQRVVEDFSLRLETGQIGCLLGASGCGKTTVLRAIAGFVPTRSGRIVLGGEVMADADIQWPPERRRVGMVFQDYALFPHLSVAANIAFGLRGMKRAACDARVRAMLEHVNMSELGARYPHELAGGQQQRVALARALAPQPKILLLDEPFSNLDIHTRARLAVELRGLLKSAGTTALLVTHDQAEAFAMADVIGVMDEGRILQWDTPRQLYEHPVHRHVAAFVGRAALVPAMALGLDGEEEVLLRPEHVQLDQQGSIQARLLERAFRGPDDAAVLELQGGERILADLRGDTVARVGDVLTFSLSTRVLPRFARD